MQNHLRINDHKMSREHITVCLWGNNAGLIPESAGRDDEQSPLVIVVMWRVTMGLE
jgi:hypothetical protein